MNRKTCTTLFSILLACTVPGSKVLAEQDSSRILDELYTRESKQPISERSGWQKPRDVVIVSSWASSGLEPETREKLQAAAGAARLHIFSNADAASKALATADVLLGSCTMYSDEMKNIRWVQHFSAGVDRCGGSKGLENGDVLLTNMKGVYGSGIAEHVMAMMLSLGRQLPRFRAAQDEARWDDGIPGKFPLVEVRGKTMLVVGLGGIGSEIAWRAKGLGMKVLATRNSSRSGPDFVDYVGLAPELHELAQKADVIVNATPLTRSTTNLFDEAFFAQLRSTAIFINIGRGKSVVTADLVAALKEGRLAGAALDVTEPEPLPSGHPLWDMDNVIITPHISAYSDMLTRRFWVFVIENLRRYVAGEAMLNTVNMKSGY